jgi:hypothetical protein
MLSVSDGYDYLTNPKHPPLKYHLITHKLYFIRKLLGGHAYPSLERKKLAPKKPVLGYVSQDMFMIE